MSIINIFLAQTNGKRSVKFRKIFCQKCKCNCTKRSANAALTNIGTTAQKRSQQFTTVLGYLRMTRIVDGIIKLNNLTGFISDFILLTISS
jgi:hypothetical protein